MIAALFHDAIRKALEPYLTNLDILRDDVAGYTVTFDKPFRHPRELDDNTFVVWYKVNEIITRLGGSWVTATRFTKAHWRIPKT